MKNTVLAALLAICAGAALVSCNKEESEIVGEWKCTDVELYYGDTEIGFNTASDCVYVLGGGTTPDGQARYILHPRTPDTGAASLSASTKTEAEPITTNI